MGRLKMEFEADLEQATWATVCIRGLAGLWETSEERLFQLELAIAEGVNNAASYSDGKVEIELDGSADGLDVAIWSEGEPFQVDFEKMEDPRNFDPENIAELATSGRGFFLLRELTESVSVQHLEGRNKLHFFIPFGTKH